MCTTTEEEAMKFKYTRNIYLHFLSISMNVYSHYNVTLLSIESYHYVHILAYEQMLYLKPSYNQCMVISSLKFMALCGSTMCHVFFENFMSTYIAHESIVKISISFFECVTIGKICVANYIPLFQTV